MTRPIPIRFDRVWKKYQLGSEHNSLSDTIPGTIRRWLKGRSMAIQDNEFWALRDVSFELQQGETLGIIGRNGAGKSTMLKLLSRIMRPTQGTISVHGTLAALLEVSAGFHPDLTGRENIFLSGTILGLRYREVSDLLGRIVEFSELGRFIDTPVKRYSSGMYVRLGFSIAAHIQPDILLLDEVLAVGDMGFQQKCLHRIQELQAAGTTMVFISHDLNAVQKICGRVLLMSNGSIAASGNVQEVVEVYRKQNASLERQRIASAAAKKTSDQAKRKIRIEEVRLRNKEDELTERFETGKPAIIEIAYHCTQRIEQLTAMISLDRLDGVLCHVASTQRDGIPLSPMEPGRGVLRLIYPAIGLLLHNYRISVELGEVGSSTPLVQEQHISFFSMSSDHHEMGIVHLDHEWQVIGQPPEV